MIRRFGERRDVNRAYSRRPGAYAILLRGCDMLLTHQDAPFSEYQLPGGGIDKGEAAIAALHREVLEETGWKISQARRLGTYRRFTFMPDYELWAEKICYIYLARPTRQVGPPLEKGHRAVWTSPKHAASMLANDGDRHFLQRYILSGL